MQIEFTSKVVFSMRKFSEVKTVIRLFDVKLGIRPGENVLWKNTETIVDCTNFYDFMIYRQNAYQNRVDCSGLKLVEENNNW